MIVALDVGYEEAGSQQRGRCGLVAFAEWRSAEPELELEVVIEDVAAYVPGEFYQRELPCLIAGLNALFAARPKVQLECVVIDGNVRLDPAGAPGLGQHLFEHLQPKVPVIGVAKNPFGGLDAIEMVRGDSAKPLYITAAGMEERAAAKLVESMAGDFRMPTLLRRADQLARGH